MVHCKIHSCHRVVIRGSTFKCTKHKYEKLLIVQAVFEGILLLGLRDLTQGGMKVHSDSILQCGIVRLCIHQENFGQNSEVRLIANDY